tara:strand:- start:686 stop:811 length:126 start_codon:yes stop_codon:yes gene_type:complete
MKRKNKYNIQESLPYEYEAKRLYKLSYEDFAKMMRNSHENH